MSSSPSPIPKIAPLQRLSPAALAARSVSTRSRYVWVETICGVKRSLVLRLWFNCPTPAAFSARALSTSSSPTEQQIPIATSARIRPTTSQSASTSFQVGPRPLATMQNRLALARLARCAPSSSVSASTQGYLAISAVETLDCEQ